VDFAAPHKSTRAGERGMRNPAKNPDMFEKNCLREGGAAPALGHPETKKTAPA